MAQIYNDTWTDTNGVAAESHTSDSGHTYTKLSGVSTTILNNRVGVNGQNYSAYYVDNLTPSDANYSVTATVYAISQNYQNNICGRYVNATNDAYVMRFYPGAGGYLRLYEQNNGVLTALGSDYSVSITTGNSYTAKLVMDGDQISVEYPPNTTVIGPVTNTTVTAAGTVCFGMAGSSGTGLHIDALSADSLAVGGATGTGTLTTSVVTLNGAGVISRSSTGALTISAVTVQGTSTRIITGSGALSTSVVTLQGAGTLGGAISGSGALTISAVTLAGSGVRTIPGAGALTISATTLTGAGVRTAKSTGSLTTSSVLVSGSGTRIIYSSGALTISAVLVSGSQAPVIAGAARRGGSTSFYVRRKNG